MVCPKCNKESADGAAFCMYCGAKLTSECRKCKKPLPQEARFCPYCGCPTSGAVCPKCGAENADDANFCIACGQRLTAAATPAASVGAQPKSGDEGIGKKVARLVRAVVLPVLLALMFISGFFGMFRQSTYLLDGATFDVGLNKPINFNGAVTVDFTGFDAVRGMFTLISPPSDEEGMREFENFLREEFSDKSIRTIDAKDLENALQKYGILRLMITGEVPASVTAQVVIWGVHTLLLMILSLVFLILAVLHVVQVLLHKKTGVYRREREIYALMAALAFAFLITGAGGMAGGSFGILMLGGIGLTYGAVHDVVFEKKAKFTPISAIRLGVCTLAVVLLTVFVSGALVTVKGYDVKAGLRKDYLLESLNDREDYAFGTGEAMQTGAYKSYLKSILQQDTLTKRQKEELMMTFAAPAVLCALKDMPNGYNVGCMVSAWLLFVFNLVAAAFTVLLLFALLSEDANNRKHKMTYYVGLIVCTAGIMGTSIAFAKLADAMGKGFWLSLSYSLSVMPVLAFVLAVLAPIVQSVLSDVEKNRQSGTPVVAATATESAPAQVQEASEPTPADEEKKEA